MMGESPQLVDHKIPQKHDSGGKDLHDHIINGGIFNADIHNDAVDACADGGDDEKFCQRLRMPFVTLKRKVLVEYVINNSANNKTETGGKHRVNRPELHEYYQGCVVAQCADSTNPGK